jgi:hypothetical protein
VILVISTNRYNSNIEAESREPENMKIPLIAASLLLLVLMLSYFVLAPTSDVNTDSISEAKAEKLVENEKTLNGSHSTNALDEEAVNENRRIEMQQAYSELEAARKQLKSRANLLKGKIWGKELPKEQATFVSHNMRKAYSYLKNPAMLGAYFEVEEIMVEEKRVGAILNNLDKVEAALK